MRLVGVCLVVLAVLVAGGVWVAPAGADRTSHTGHIALEPLGGTPLTSGFVQDIHANGPNVYLHEAYQLNGAEANTSYQVVGSIWATNRSCSGEPTLRLATAAVTTNPAGNGLADAVVTPAAADGLRGLTVSVMWTLWNGTTAAYATGCEVIGLDY